MTGGPVGDPAAMELFAPREVPLGGPRAMTVRRTLPTRRRTTIGAWCFVDHYGPDDVSVTGGMALPPHPHTGLCTVSWLFSGSIEHRDSAGHVATVRPGELSLMTAGRAISHSEYSTADTTTLHGAQLWIALPDASRGVAPRFDHHRPDPVTGDGWEARVFLGALCGVTSPVGTHAEVLGAELRLAPGTELDLAVPRDHELGLLVDTGEVATRAGTIRRHQLGRLPPGRDTLGLRAGAEGARLLLLGGEPFGEQIVMWWNFVGRTHQEILAAREHWQQCLATGHDDLFGLPADDPAPPIPAPPMPNLRLKPRP